MKAQTRPFNGSPEPFPKLGPRKRLGLQLWGEGSTEFKQLHGLQHWLPQPPGLPPGEPPPSVDRKEVGELSVLKGRAQQQSSQTQGHRVPLWATQWQAMTSLIPTCRAQAR